jgi:hypothetical protein
MPGIELSLSDGNLVPIVSTRWPQSPLQVGLTDDAFTITSPANHTLTITAPGGQVVFRNAPPFPLDHQGITIEYPQGGTIKCPPAFHRQRRQAGGSPLHRRDHLGTSFPHDPSCWTRTRWTRTR